MSSLPPSHLGPIPQDGDINLSPSTFRLNLGLGIIATVVLIFRLIARAEGGWKYGWDDCTMLLAWVRLLTGTNPKTLLIL